MQDLQPTSLTSIAQNLFDAHSSKIGFLGGILLGNGSQVEQFECLLGSGLPAAPFNGADRQVVVDLLSDCASKYPAPHVHNCGSLNISAVAARHGKWGEVSKRAWYFPFGLESRNLTLIGFLKQSDKRNSFVEDLSWLQDVTTLLIQERELKEARRKLAATEAFVREVGHDFAGNVQAVLAKVFTLKRGGLNDQAAMRKLQEIEIEIRRAYSQADQLGITIDSSYVKRNQTQVALAKVVEEVVNQLEGEAKERKITFNCGTGLNAQTASVWGDNGAIAVCVLQIMLNAIKYAYENSRIDVEYSGDAEFVHLQISNVGHALPRGEEEKKIWDLGYRGEEAKGLHVNGSGVGLFTVSKIVKAHFGACSIRHNNGRTVFILKLPRRDIERNKVGVQRYW